jgi:CelD/BcsL family acetyltransferase involved in cellulose biosynthesis
MVPVAGQGEVGARSDVTVTVEVHEGVGDDGLVAEWDALHAADPHATMFQTARWQRRFDAVLGGQRTLRTLAFRREGQLLGLVAESRELRRLPSGPSELLRLAGGDEVTDYLGPLSLPQERAAVADAYCAALAAERGWDEVVLGGLAADTGWHEHLALAARTHGLTVADAAVEAVCPVVDLSGGYDAYLIRLPGRMRQEAVRKARKLTRDVGPYEMFTFGAGALDEGLEAFLAQARAAEDEKSTFFHRAEMQRWFAELAAEYGPEGTLRIHRLDVAGMPAAMTVSLVADGRWGLYNSAFDPTLAAFAPGVVLVWELIALAAEEGCHTFDLLRGDEPYKYRFGAVDRELHTLTLLRGDV